VNSVIIDHVVGVVVPKPMGIADCAAVEQFEETADRILVGNRVRSEIDDHSIRQQAARFELFERQPRLPQAWIRASP